MVAWVVGVEEPPDRSEKAYENNGVKSLILNGASAESQA